MIAKGYGRKEHIRDAENMAQHGDIKHGSTRGNHRLHGTNAGCRKKQSSPWHMERHLQTNKISGGSEANKTDGYEPTTMKRQRLRRKSARPYGSKSNTRTLTTGSEERPSGDTSIKTRKNGKGRPGIKRDVPGMHCR
jgi:hypothetical protein